MDIPDPVSAVSSMTSGEQGGDLSLLCDGDTERRGGDRLHECRFLETGDTDRWSHCDGLGDRVLDRLFLGTGDCELLEELVDLDRSLLLGEYDCSLLFGERDLSLIDDGDWDRECLLFRGEGDLLLLDPLGTNMGESSFLTASHILLRGGGDSSQNTLGLILLRRGGEQFSGELPPGRGEVGGDEREIRVGSAGGRSQFKALASSLLVNSNSSGEGDSGEEASLPL